MSDSSVPASRHLRQQHTLAKDLIRAARAGDSAAQARLKVLFPNRRQYKLADAQLVIARDAGFDSWTALVRHVEQQERNAAAKALHDGDATELRRLLAGSDYLRSIVNAPIFDFGRRAVHIAANSPAIIDVLLEFGADPNATSDWDKGPYVPLDEATEASARHLIARGATLTPNVAARLGWIDDLRSLLAADPAAVHHRGGDGRQPLHEACNESVAALLLDHGAEIDCSCFDHESTPAQCALVERPEVCRLLLNRGARPDVFMAARLGDAALAARVLEQDPAAAGARIHLPGYAAVPPCSIYCWTLGSYKSPRQVAIEAGHPEVAEVILAASDSRVRLLDAAWTGNAAACRQLLAADACLPVALRPEDHSLLAHAAHLRHDEVFDLMLSIGFDPSASGVDGGTALHQAAWTGGANMVTKLLRTGKCDLEGRDPTHGSTPLGWALHGSVHRRHARGDYAATVTLLLDAGARLDVPGNKLGRPMIEMASGNPQIEALIRSRARVT